MSMKYAHGFVVFGFVGVASSQFHVVYLIIFFVIVYTGKHKNSKAKIVRK